MKTFFDILSVVFLALGGLIGAGFVSGSELVSFFGAENFFLPLVLSCACLFLFINLTFSFARQQSFESASNTLFGSRKVVDGVVFITSFVLFCSMLAGLDAVWKGLNFLPNLPVLSVGCLVAVSLLSRNGIKGIERWNVLLMPTVVLIVVSSAFRVVKLGEPCLINVSFFSGVNGVLYSALNTFICLPVLFDTAYKKPKRLLKVCAIIISLTVFCLAYLILSTIKQNDGSENAEMPFFYAISKKGFSPLLFLALLMGTVTSASTSYYAVYKKIYPKYSYKGLVIVGVVAFVFSRLGMNLIVKYVYPLIGGLGVVFVLKMFLEKIKIARIKQGQISDNNFIFIKEKKPMSKKKKNKIAKLSDQQYAEYIMSLKDEKPPKIVRETQE